uniref:Uncharacterized protein n=1 Tax=Timema genevievae TaxID=629358 RepID=A0A7R9K2X0_TIMGE|nr:unnamed protein product [Timema genevievae]
MMLSYLSRLFLTNFWWATGNAVRDCYSSPMASLVLTDSQHLDQNSGDLEYSGRHSPDRDSNLDLPILGSLSQHDTSALSNYATEAGFGQTDKRASDRASDWVAKLASAVRINGNIAQVSSGKRSKKVNGVLSSNSNGKYRSVWTQAQASAGNF